MPSRGLPPAGSPWGDDSLCHAIVATRDPAMPVLARCERGSMGGEYWCEVHRRSQDRHDEWVSILRSDWPTALARARKRA